MSDQRSHRLQLRESAGFLRSRSNWDWIDRWTESQEGNTMDYPMTSSMQRREEVVAQAPPAGLGACIHSDLAQQMALLSRAIDDLQASLGPILRSQMPKPAGQSQAAVIDRSSLHHAVADLTTQAAALVEQVVDIERRLDL